MALSVIVSLLALAFLIWAITSHQLNLDQRHAYTIFVPGEAGTAENATLEKSEGAAETTHYFDPVRAGIDQVSRGPITMLLTSAITWLVIGSVFGLISSLELHWRDWLDTQAWLTFAAYAPRALTS